jgi:hypothetical protein
MVAHWVQLWACCHQRDIGVLWLLAAHGSRWSLGISCARMVGDTLGDCIDLQSFAVLFLSLVDSCINPERCLRCSKTLYSLFNKTPCASS